MNDNDDKGFKSYMLYTIAWIAALAVERAAAEAMLDEQHEEPLDFVHNPSDANEYTWGRMGVHNIVIASLPAGIYGTTAAATTAAHLASSLPHIKIGVLVGIAGAIPQLKTAKDANGAVIETVDKHLDIRLGDVVVGRPEGTSGGVVQYDLGKSKLGQVWERKGSLNAPPHVLLAALSRLQSEHRKGNYKIPGFLEKMLADYPSMAKPRLAKDVPYTHQGYSHDILFQADYGHLEGESDCSNCEVAYRITRQERETTDPDIHYGIIASGNTLVKDAFTRDKISQSTGERCICYEMEAAGIVSYFPCLVIRGICDYADSHKNDRWQPYASATAAAFAKELLFYCSLKKLRVEVPLGEISSLREALLKFTMYTAKATKTMDNLQVTADKAVQQSLLNQLPIATEARHDSYTEGINSKCLQNTRVDVLKEIFEWLDGDGARLFWLHGMAGTGKSTISRTLAKTLELRGQLGASFFFKRGEADRGTLKKFCGTIAADLSDRYPAFGAEVLKTVSDNATVTTKAAPEQFKHLILNPLSMVKLDQWTGIIIDALDECAPSEIHILFDLISDFKNAGLSHVKLFLTGRPDLPILQGFSTVENYYDGIVLHNIEKSIIERDIQTFLENELVRIRHKSNHLSGSSTMVLDKEWPGPEKIQTLVAMSNKLFIFAATICRFINESNLGSPAVLLEEVLKYQTKTTIHAFGPTYLPVLDSQISESTPHLTKQTVMNQITTILGAIIILADPLSVPALARLVGLSTLTVEHRLSCLRSVIDVVNPDESSDLEASQIRLVHLSFRDFLVAPEIKGVSPFWIDETNAHKTLMSNCLRALLHPVGGLKFNICGLNTPGVLRSTISRDTISKRISSELQYSCLYLALHMKSAKANMQDTDNFYHKFLLTHFLHWLEVLCLIGRVFEISRIIYIFHECIHPTTGRNVKMFLDDATRFISAHREILDIAPLQIYSSALIFSPRKSIVRTTFEQRYTGWIKRKPRVQQDWGLEFQTIKVHEDDGIHSLSISPDEKYIASISYEKVKVVSIAGEHMLEVSGILNYHRDYDGPYVVTVFSSDSKWIAIEDDTENIQIWSIADSKCIKSLKTNHHGPRHSDSMALTSFTDDDTCILTASKTCAWIWSITAQTVVRKIRLSSRANRLALVPNQFKLAVQTQDRLEIWDLDSCRIVRTEDSKDWDFEAAPGCLELSPSMEPWMVYWDDWNFKIVSPVSGETLLSYDEEVSSYLFTNNYVFIAFHFTETIDIWHIESRKLVQVLSCTRPRDTMAYSHKSSLLILSSCPDSNLAGIIFFWKVNMDELKGKYSHTSSETPPEEECWGWSDYYYTTPDCTQLVSANKSHMRIWSADSVEDFPIAQEGNIQFSTTSQYVSFAERYRTAIRVWQLQPTPAIVSTVHYELAAKSIISATFFSPDCTILGLVTDKCSGTPATNSRGSTDSVDLFSIETRQLTTHLDMAGSCIYITYGACLSADNTLLAIAVSRGVSVWKIDHNGAKMQNIFATSQSARELFEVDNAHALTYVSDQDPVQFSWDSSLLLHIKDWILDIWHVTSGACLHRVSRDGLFQASFHPNQSRVLTSIGNISYSMVSETTSKASRHFWDVVQSRTHHSDFSQADQSNRRSKEGLAMSCNWSGWGMSKDLCWIRWNNENWLWLPLDWRYMRGAVDGNCVLIFADAVGVQSYEFVDFPKLEDRVESQHIDRGV